MYLPPHPTRDDKYAPNQIHPSAHTPPPQDKDSVSMHKHLLDVNTRLQAFINEAHEEFRILKCQNVKIHRALAASHGPSSGARLNVEDSRPLTTPYSAEQNENESTSSLPSPYIFIVTLQASAFASTPIFTPFQGLFSLQFLVWMRHKPSSRSSCQYLTNLSKTSYSLLRPCWTLQRTSREPSVSLLNVAP
ncbi:hypothetical protein ACOSQ3_004061 [Xanthoceras sorbifolium]